MFIKQTLLYLPAQAASTVAQFLSVIAWTYFLLPSDLGVLNLVIAMHEFLYCVLIWWWAAYTLRSLTRWAGADADMRARFERTEAGVLVGALALHVVLVAVLVLATIQGSANDGVIPASIAFAVSRSLIMYLSDRTRAAQRIGLYSILQVSWSVIGFGFGLVLVRVMGSSAVWPLVGTAAAQLAAAAFVFWQMGARSHSIRLDAEILRAAAKFGGPLVGVSALGWVSLYGNRFIIDYFLGPAAVGLYSVGNGLADRSVTLALTLVGSATLPLAIQEMREKGLGAGMERLKLASTMVLAIMLPIATGLSVLAGPISEVLVGPQYREATTMILPVAAWSAVIFGLYTHLPGQAAMLAERPGILFGTSAATAVSGMILTVVLIQWMGLNGVAWARLLSIAVTSAVVSQLCVRRLGMRFPMMELMKLSAASALMALALLAVPASATMASVVAHVLMGAAICLPATALLFRGEITVLLDRHRGRLLPSEGI